MLERIVLLCIGVLVSLPLSYVAVWAGRRWSLLDKPGVIKPHARPTPYTGGAAVLAVVLGAGITLNVPASALIGAVAMWLIGFADDIRSLRPAWKLAGTAVPLVIAVSTLGTQPLVAALAVVLGVILVNAFNVIDGLDGLAGGVASFALLPLLLIDHPLASLGVITLGAVIGFLVFNLHPARLFLGDEGSLLLGYVLWLMAVYLVATRPTPTSFAFAVLMWTFPIVNAVFVLMKRLRESRPLWVGDRGHLYDILQRRYGLRVTITICWGIAAAGSTLAAALQY